MIQDGSIFSHVSVSCNRSQAPNFSSHFFCLWSVPLPCAVGHHVLRHRDCTPSRRSDCKIARASQNSIPHRIVLRARLLWPCYTLCFLQLGTNHNLWRLCASPGGHSFRALFSQLWIYELNTWRIHRPGVSLIERPMVEIDIIHKTQCQVTFYLAIFCYIRISATMCFHRTLCDLRISWYVVLCHAVVYQVIAYHVAKGYVLVWCVIFHLILSCTSWCTPRSLS